MRPADQTRMWRDVNAQMGADFARFWRSQLGVPSIDGYRDWIARSVARQGKTLDLGVLEREIRGGREPNLTGWRQAANAVMGAEKAARIDDAWDGPASALRVPPGSDGIMAAAAYDLGVSWLDLNSRAHVANRVRRFIDVLYAHTRDLSRGPAPTTDWTMGAEAAKLTLAHHPELTPAYEQTFSAVRAVVADAVEGAIAVEMASPDGQRTPRGAGAEMAAAAVVVGGALALGDALEPAPIAALVEDFLRVGESSSPVNGAFTATLETLWSSVGQGFVRHLGLQELDDPRFGPNQLLVEDFIKAVVNLTPAQWAQIATTSIEPTPFAPSVSDDSLPVGRLLETEARRLHRFVAYNAAGRRARRRAAAPLGDLAYAERSRRARPSLRARISGEADRGQMAEDEQEFEQRHLRCAAVAQAAASLVLAGRSPDWMAGYAAFAGPIPPALGGG